MKVNLVISGHIYYPKDFSLPFWMIEGILVFEDLKEAESHVSDEINGSSYYKYEKIENPTEHWKRALSGYVSECKEDFIFILDKDGTTKKEMDAEEQKNKSLSKLKWELYEVREKVDADEDEGEKSLREIARIKAEIQKLEQQ